MEICFIISFGLVLTLLATKILLLFVSCIITNSLQPFRDIEYKEDAFQYLSIYLLFFGVSYLMQRGGIFENNTESFVTIWIITFLFSLIPLSVLYIISPIYYLLKSKKNHSLIERDLVDRFYGNQKMFVIEDGGANAFASGIIPFTKVILLTKSIFEQVSKEGLHAIVAHELGHLKLNHLRKLYIINIVLLAITTLVYSLLILPHMASPYYVYYLMAFGGVFYGLIPMLILGFFQKKFETQADAYAARKVGKKAMITALEDLNKATKGQMERWSPNYPTLDQRISHVTNLTI